MPGDPNCPICHGIGFVRQDLPLNHPDFGRMAICSCRQGEVAQKAHQHLYQMSNLDAFKDMNFDAFNIQGRLGLAEEQIKSLEYARNQAMSFAQSLKGWLLLMGGYGCGKTHLMAAIANYTVSLGIPTLFLTVPDLLDWLRYSYDNPETSYEQRFEEIRNISLLALDDIGTQNATPWAQEKLFQIVNHRYVNRLPLVMTTNLTFEQIDGRISSRLQDPDLVVKVKISAPDYRMPMTDTLQPRLSSLHLHSGRTFGNFSLREHEKMPPEDQQSLEKAFRAAQQFAEEPHGWLVLNGPYGCGKTHLAAAIGNYRLAEGEAPVFVVVPDLLDHLRATFSPQSTVTFDRLFEEVRTARLLILDGLETQSASPWAREKLYQIINYRYYAELPTVITTASRVDDIDPRLMSRLSDMRLCKNYLITAPAYRGGVGTGAVKKTPAQRKTKA
jgi:DNA replication protein DnaC